MQPGEAEAVAKGFARALLAQDVEAATSWFAPGARILTSDGTELIGRDRVREVLTQIADAAQELEIHPGRTIATDDIALTTQLWRRSAGRDDPSEYEAVSTARLVLARADRWEIVIASPWE
jgi:ketosteroid isomerase-like protein